uniref:Uncharacterized protein n=1 Tax=Romanomermis culicivorax TaxID=13658 RepID=A0A915IC01_ROMCU
MKALEYLDDLLSPGSPVFGEEGFRLDSSLVVPLFCSKRSDMVTYYRCLIDFFNYVFNSMPILDGAMTNPKMDRPIQNENFPIQNAITIHEQQIMISDYHLDFRPINRTSK